MRQDARCRVGGVGHRGVAEHDQAPPRGVGDQAHGGAQDEGERALAADQRPGHVEAALGQQVLEGVAGHLAPEPAELGADRAEVGVDDAAQPGEQDVGVRGVGPARSRPQPQPGARAGHDVEADDVVRGAAVAERPGPAGVVADHPADGAPVVRARVGAEPQPVRPAPAPAARPGRRRARRRPGAPRGRRRARGPGAGWCRRRRPGRRRCRRSRCRRPGRSAGPRGCGTPRASRRSRPGAGAARRPGAGRGRASRRRSRAPGSARSRRRPRPRRGAGPRAARRRPRPAGGKSRSLSRL